MALLRAAVELLFPPRCRVCRSCPEYPLCSRCRARFPLVAPPVCQICGQPGAGAVDRVFTCVACRRHPPPFTRARAGGVYEGSLRDAIHAFKFEGCRVLAGPLGTLMAAVAADAALGADLILPVPLHPRRLRERGFNQAELLAAEVAARLAYPLARDVLLRVRETASQTGLTRGNRRANVSGAFAIRGRLPGSRVLLVDDVRSTGSTVSECARTLRAAGAGTVWVVTAAVAVLEGSGTTKPAESAALRRLTS